MKKLFLILGLIILLTFNINAQKLHWYPFSKNVENTNVKGQMKVQIAFKDSTIFLAPSVAFDVFSKEKDTGEYNLGIIPGIGYGLKWNPYKWKNDYLIGVDVFAQAALNAPEGTSKYFNVRILPTFTLLNWIHIGYGPMWKIGLNGNSNINTSVFTLGISKSL
jgi:hypothetical protein